MLISYSQLINLPVETKSNEFLGKICDLEIDIDNFSIKKLHVKSNNLIRGLFEGVLIIDRQQIFEITTEKVVVEDQAKKIKEKKHFKIKLAEENKTTAVTTSKSE